MKQTSARVPDSGERHQVRLSREFEFPRELVFGMMTDPKKAARWFGSPEGAVKLLFEFDPRPGGAIRLHDRASDGTVGRTSGSFVEVETPERISFKTATTLNDSAAPFEALQTMIFEALTPSRTRLTVLVDILSTGSFSGGAESLAAGYTGGWGQTLDMLQRELEHSAAQRQRTGRS